METIINNPGGGNSEGSGVGVVVGILVAIVIIGLFFVYGLPRLRNNQAPEKDSLDVKVELPGGDNSAPAPY